MFQTVVLEKTLESPLGRKEIKPVNPKGNQPWIFIGRTDAEGPIPWPPLWWKELIRWKRPSHWERLKAGEGDDRGWDGWMASMTQWTWVWSSSGIPSKEIPGLISFRLDWLALLAVQGTLKSLLQHHSSKASILRHSAFFTVHHNKCCSLQSQLEN